MAYRLLRGALVLALVLASQGCLGGRSTGPLDVEIARVVIHDPNHLNVSLAFHNDGPAPLQDINANLLVHVFDPEKRTITQGFGSVHNVTGSYRGARAIFNDTDVLGAGEWRNFTFEIEMDTFGEGPPVRSVDYYLFELSVQTYNDGKFAFKWIRGLGCWDMNGTRVAGFEYCDRTFYFGKPRPLG